jgi:hypothetical protein
MDMGAVVILLETGNHYTQDRADDTFGGGVNQRALQVFCIRPLLLATVGIDISTCLGAAVFTACPARLITIVGPLGIRHLLTRTRATVCRGVPAPGPPAEYGGFPFRQLRKNICSYNASADAHAFATGPEQGRGGPQRLSR